MDDYMDFEEFADFYGSEIEKLMTMPKRVIELMLWQEYTGKIDINDLFLRVGIDECESPIETLFYTAIREKTFNTYYEFYVKPQHEIKIKEKTYRVDFLISEQCAREWCNKFDIKKHYGLVIECDGHEFHEKTKEQVAYSNQRDLDIKMAGYDILHFSGSQIYKNPYKCVDESIDYYIKKVEEHYARIK